MKAWLRLTIGGALGLGFLSASLFGCSSEAKKEAEKIIGTDVNGLVTDNRGAPVADATVRLYTLHSEFVQGSNILKAEAYINREAVLGSSNTERVIQTGADGHFKMEKVLPSAFLAVAVKDGCSAGFAGFNEETGILNAETLIKPTINNGVEFNIPGFVIACATPPEVPEGNTGEAPLEPEQDAGVDPVACAALGGQLVGDSCVVTCSPAVCAASGGTCNDAGTCVVAPPACDPAACGDGGGSCQEGKCVLTVPSCVATECARTGGTCVDGVCNVPTCDPATCQAAGGSCGADGGACAIPACNPQICASAGGTCPAGGGTCVIPTCNAAACADAGGSCAEDGGTCVIASCDQTPCVDAGGAWDEDSGACVMPPACDPVKCRAAGGSCGADGGACAIPTCNAVACADAGGHCGAEGGTCVIPTCDQTACRDAGGSCAAEGGSCVIPPCIAKEAECKAKHGACSADGTTCVVPPCFANEAACQAKSGRCSTDGKLCQVPECKADTDCQATQPDAVCLNPGDVELAKCDPPPPDCITPPAAKAGWTSFIIKDEHDQVLADATSGNVKIALPTDAEGLPAVVRVYGTYSGGGTGTVDHAYVQVQSLGRGIGCLHHRPRTDFVAVDVENGSLASETDDFIELPLHGGYQKIQLTTSEGLGQGDRSFTIEIGERCARPIFPFIAILSWDAGRRVGRSADLDLNVWNKSGQLVHLGNRQWPWGRFRHHWHRGPGPEVFVSFRPADGPYTIRVQYFAGRTREVWGKVRIIHLVDDNVRDQTFRFKVTKPRDVVEIGTF